MKWLLCIFFFLALGSGTFSETLDFSMPFMDGNGRKVSLKPHQNRPLLILYYSLECSKCRDAVEILSRVKERTCADLIGIVTSSEPEALFNKNTRPPFAYYYDKYRSLKVRFKIETVPTLILVDAKGRIVYQKQKYYKDNYEALVGVLASKCCPGQKPFQESMTKRYYGAAVCAPCHSSIFNWWEKTPHALVYDSIAKMTFKKSGFREGQAERIPPELLRLSTTGFGTPGGYDPQLHQKGLLGVQCEACHGPGGAHGSGKTRDYEPRCVQCHDTVRDPTFQYGRMRAKLNHPK